MSNEDEPNKPENVDKSGSDSDWDSSSSYSSDSDKEGEPEEDPLLYYTRSGQSEPDTDDNSPEANFKRFASVLDSKRMKRIQEEEDEEYVFYEDRFDFPKDRENWREEDLKELWGDAPIESTKPGWDPNWADEEDWDIVREEIKAGRDPPFAPFYIPYRKHFPAIPDNHHDISNPKAVIEELDRIEEFLTWESYIFADGSSYEGTVWDDLAHGKGVYVAEQGMVRYEGEWLQNNMEGHGVVEVEIPGIEPVPGSKLEAKMRAEGKIIKRDFMSPEDREWLEMDIEDSLRLVNGNYVVPFYENEEWIRQFGMTPEKGRYRYAGQWKHGRMHGCGVYEVNERPIRGRFYFGEIMEDPAGCDENISTMHASIAEVAAAKARMFVNKPDGMIREERGPYSDPQHPYFYEEEDAWMAPGFINQFYEVPDYWKTYVHEVDEEREMWLNSFYKAPLRLPMPAELEHWWSKDHDPEFVLINKEPEPDPSDPSRLIYTEDPLIMHTRTGRLIDYVEDEEHGIRLFWKPPLKDGEYDPDEIKFLPLGYDEFFGREAEVKQETIWTRLIKTLENVCMPTLEKLEKWTEEKKKECELKREVLELEMELVEAEICLEEAIEDMTEDLKREEKEEEEKAKMDVEVEEATTSVAGDEKASAMEEEEDDDDEDEEGEGEEEDDIAESSFGSAIADQNAADGRNGKSGKSPFATTSLYSVSYGLLSMVLPKVQRSFSSWKLEKPVLKSTPPLCNEDSVDLSDEIDSVAFPRMICQMGRLRACRQAYKKMCTGGHSRQRTTQLHSLSRILFGNSKRSSLKEQSLRSQSWLHAAPERDSDSILSLNIPVNCLEPYIGVFKQ